jgi:hypothetical protein
VRNENALHRVKEKRNVLRTVKRRKMTNLIGHILRRNCVIKGSIEGKKRSDEKTRKKMQVSIGLP